MQASWSLPLVVYPCELWNSPQFVTKIATHTSRQSRKGRSASSKGNSAAGDAAPRCQQPSDYRQHSSAQSQGRAIGGDTSPPPRCAPARHVGGDGAAATARLRAKRKDRDRALSDQAVRQSCSLDGRRTPGASIKVQASSGGAVSSDAVSLGLIVTELVINALKHGFSAGAEGEILVSYDAKVSAGGFRFLTMDRGRRTQVARPRVSALARASSRPWRISSTRWCRKRVEPRVPRSQLLPPQSARSRNAHGAMSAMGQ